MWCVSVKVVTVSAGLYLPSLLMTLEHHFNKKVFNEQFIQIYNEEDEIDLDELKLEGEEYDEDK